MASYKTCEAFEALKQYMQENYRAKIVSGGREILKRCHFCGDSRDPSNAHMYIGMTNDGAIVYNCFKCNAKGLVDGKFLRDLGSYDTSIMMLCQDQNKKSGSSNQSKNGTLRLQSFSREPIIPLYTNDFGMKKLDYLSRRMGHPFNTADAARFKIILNLKDFLDINGITRYTRNPNVIDIMDKFFIGFLSMDNRYIILRSLVPEGKLPEYIDHRYVNYDIFGGYQDGMKYYTIPNMINPAIPVDIHIAEGAFDILSIYLHTAPLGTNGIFSAAGGKQYLALVRFFITQFGFSGFNLHLYPDSDIPNYQMQRIKEDIAPFNINVYIHRNRFQGEKDYGVSMDRIIDGCTKI